MISRLLVSVHTFGLCCLIMSLWLACTSFSCGEEESGKNQVDQKGLIGKVLGKSIYRSDVVGETDSEFRINVASAFLSPLLDKYKEEHKAEIDPTEKELIIVAGNLEKRLAEVEKEEGESEALTELQSGTPSPEAQLKMLEDALIEVKNFSPEEQEEIEQHKELLDQYSKRIELLRKEIQYPSYRLAIFMFGHWKFQKHLYDEFGGGRVMWQQRGVEAFDATHNLIKQFEEEKQFEVFDPKVREELYHYWTREDSPFLTADPERVKESFLQPEWLKGIEFDSEESEEKKPE
ncbi:hypothetical protein Pla110_20560 [Polystyrenella longa]|uniref:Uncharacterized protein n=1 Tax=Polystyrenella longa TaxID=2528007 RepID=A0A518CM70_9PLAN|nr:hypothetical protein [Polystyrenella longa]QDU80329.1 hypothetical protein Pla110_20560 [Polystyrenella longa]